MITIEGFNIRDLIPDVILSDHVDQAKDADHRKHLLDHKEDPDPAFHSIYIVNL
jgi:hypothetical protein